jgi:hypothetical protein
MPPGTRARSTAGDCGWCSERVRLLLRLPPSMRLTVKPHQAFFLTGTGQVRPGRSRTRSPPLDVGPGTSFGSNVASSATRPRLLDGARSHPSAPASMAAGPNPARRTDQGSGPVLRSSPFRASSREFPARPRCSASQSGSLSSGGSRCRTWPPLRASHRTTGRGVIVCVICMICLLQLGSEIGDHLIPTSASPKGDSSAGPDSQQGPDRQTDEQPQPDERPGDLNQYPEAICWGCTGKPVRSGEADHHAEEAADQERSEGSPPAERRPNHAPQDGPGQAGRYGKYLVQRHASTRRQKSLTN